MVVSFVVGGLVAGTEVIRDGMVGAGMVVG